MIIPATKSDIINVRAVIGPVPCICDLLFVLEVSALVDHLSQEHGQLATREAADPILECPADRRRWSRVARSDHRVL